MPYLQKSADPTTLINQEDKPNLNCTVPFRHILDSLPEKHPVPASIIKLGLLTRHLEPEPEEYEIDTTNLDIASTSITSVRPQTLARIRWLLSNYTSDLTDPEKERVGDLCSASGLNRPPEMGSGGIQEIKATSKTAVDGAIFNLQSSKNFECEHCGDKYDSISALNSHAANCDHQQNENQLPSYNKEYTCDNCGKSFVKEKTLIGHINETCKERQNKNNSNRSTHEKEYTCENCNESFKKRNALRVHKKRNCNEQSSESSSGSAREKEYTCESCNESFKKRNALRVHKKRNCDEQSSESSSEKRPSFGKEIRKDRGSERVSGRNPFADPKKLKDTGLHQGGG